MAKFQGTIGFALSVETAPGVHQEQISEVEYTGDFLRSARNWDTSQTLNDDISLNSRISVIADQYVAENVAYIRFVRYNGTAWKVTKVEYEWPRIILTFGSVWNG